MTKFAVINQVAYVAGMFSIWFIFWRPCVSADLFDHLEIIISIDNLIELNLFRICNPQLQSIVSKQVGASEQVSFQEQLQHNR